MNGMKAKRLFFIKFAGFIVFLFIYCEYLIYYVVLMQCNWPQLKNENNANTVKFMVLADTHLLGSRNGHWFDKLRREWQMYRAFQTAMFLHKPDIVFVLGDLTDEGHFCSQDEFDYYARRFYSLFSVPEGTQMYVAVGNHDIGFHYSITPYKNNRFVKAFNTTGIQMISVKGNYFVLVNSMALEGDGCFLCKPAEKELIRIERLLNCYQNAKNCEPNVKRKKYSKPILMQHYPLYRESDIDCNEPDEAPFPLKATKFREKWECLSKEATQQLLKQIKPRLAISGHTHHGCTRPLLSGEGIEITLPSFSWRNKINPSYALFRTTPNEYAFFKCPMPVEITVINLYICGGLTMVIWLIYNRYLYIRKQKYKYK